MTRELRGNGGEPFDFASFADRLMAAGDNLAEQLRNPRSRPGSPWTQQILEEWAEAKDLAGWLPDDGCAPTPTNQRP